MAKLSTEELLEQFAGLGQAGGHADRQLQPLLDGLAQHRGEGARVLHQQDALGQGRDRRTVEGGLWRTGYGGESWEHRKV